MFLTHKQINKSITLCMLEREEAEQRKRDEELKRQREEAKRTRTPQGRTR